MLTYKPMTLSKPWRVFWGLVFAGAVIWSIGWGDGGMVLDCYSDCHRQPWFWKSHLLPRHSPFG